MCNTETVLKFYLLLGDLGKELKNLITLMDQEEQQQREKEQKNATLNKESPVWFPEKRIPCFLTKKQPTHRRH